MGSPLDAEFPVPTIDLTDKKKIFNIPHTGPVGPMPIIRTITNPNGPSSTKRQNRQSWRRDQSSSVGKYYLKKHLQNILEEVFKSKDFSEEEIENIIEEVRVKVLMEE